MYQPDRQIKFPHLFGPVPSRRLGRSLGVDMVPFKTCTCNCVYCELGSSPVVTDERKEYIPAREIIRELDQFLTSTDEIDYVTFGGSGEPTLNTALGEVLQYVKITFPRFNTALLTNATQFHRAEVREAALPFDLVLPSLDAVSEKTFRKINRPHPDITAQRIIDGLLEFAGIYRGRLWLELFIVPGINDTPEELALLKEAIGKIRPSRLQLNSLDRPGACSWVTTASPRQLSAVAEYFRPLPVEIISRKAVDHMEKRSPARNLDATIIHQLRRRPATIEEISTYSGTTINESLKTVETLISQKAIVSSMTGGRLFYSVAQ